MMKTTNKSKQIESSTLKTPMLSSDELENGSSISISTTPELHMFDPTNECPNLKLLSDINKDSKISIVVRRRSLLVVLAKYNDWRFVLCDGYSGWLNYDNSCIENKVVVKIKSFRRYEEWKGNNYFLLHGKIMLGSDAKLMGFSYVLIIVPSVFIFHSIVPELGQYNSSMMSIIGLILLLYSSLNLLLAGVTEPGILPRNDPEPHVNAVLPTGASTTGPNAWKYCETCNIYRPPRSKHCTACQNCVEIFDHHCPWTGNCIAKRNYKYFYRFVIAVTLYSIWAVLSCIFVLMLSYYEYEDHSDNYKFMKVNLIAVIVGIVCSVCMWSLISLCLYHLYLMYLGETTNENLRGAYTDIQNTYDKGCCINCYTICCPASTPSLIPDQSGVITAQEYIDKMSLVIAKQQDICKQQIKKIQAITAATTNSNTSSNSRSNSNSGVANYGSRYITINDQR